jgi:hypothetical protein
MSDAKLDKQLKRLKTTLEAKAKQFKEIREMEDTSALINQWLEEYGQNPLDIVVDFIKEKGLKMYGGKALHEHLVKFKRGFYGPHEFPDYDVFSPNAWQHAKELADRLNKAGFMFVEAKGSVLNDSAHQTYKVGVGMTYVLDLTQEGCPRDDILNDTCGGCGIESEFYVGNKGKCVDVFNAIPANDLLDYNPQKTGAKPKEYRKTYDFKTDKGLYPDSLFVASPEYLKISMSRELSEPLSHPDRLPKVGTRSHLFNHFFKFDNSVCKMGESDELYRHSPLEGDLKKVLDFILEWSNKRELIHYGTYAYNFFIKGEKGVKYPKLNVVDYEMYSPDAVIDALELVEALNKKFKKFSFKSFDKTQYWKETDAHSSEILMENDGNYIYLAELTNYDNCFPYLQYSGVRYAGIEKMLNIYRRGYVMRPIIEAGTPLTKNYECMLATLIKLYEKNKKIGSRGKFRIVTSHCTGREMSKIVGNLRLKSIKKEQQLRDTKYILDSPKKGMLTKINPLPIEKLELPYYPAHQKLKNYYRKESGVKTKKKGKTVTRNKTKLVKLSRPLTV